MFKGRIGIFKIIGFILVAVVAIFLVFKASITGNIV